MQVIIPVVFLAVVAGYAWASDMGTPEEAKAMSLKAQAAVNEMGSEKAFAVFADPDGGFREKDLYVFCVDMDGILLSQPLKPELVGENLYDFNKYGDLLFQDMIAVAKESGKRNRTPGFELIGDSSVKTGKWMRGMSARLQTLV